MKLYKKLDDGSFEEATLVKAFETQKDLDDFMKTRVDQEHKKFADYDEIKTSLEDANKKLTDFESEKTSLEEQLQAKAKEVETATLNATRVEVRSEFGLSKDLDKLLTGDTEEEIREKAELLKKSGSGGVVVTKDENGGGGAAESASKELANGLFGSKDE